MGSILVPHGRWPRCCRSGALISLTVPDDPWCWYIYLHNWVIYGVNVGKYSIHGWSGSFVWNRDRLMAMLTFFALVGSNIIPPQLCHPAWVHCWACAAPCDAMEEAERNEAEAGEFLRAEESSASRIPVRKATKYGRCIACKSARRPWIYHSGPRAGQAALVCGKLFDKKGKKCFVFERMTSDQALFIVFAQALFHSFLREVTAEYPPMV